MTVGQFTYLVLARRVQMVKIGKSAKPKERLLELQTGSPVNLELIEYTSQIPEEFFHNADLLKTHHSHGEWYCLNYGFIWVFETLVDLYAPHSSFATLDLRDYLLSDCIRLSEHNQPRGGRQIGILNDTVSQGETGTSHFIRSGCLS